jgi:hypothetical protein
MSIGAILAGFGALVVVVAYVARPFRTATSSGGWDRAIEAWVARARDEEAAVWGAEARTEHSGDVARDAAAVNFCPQCGRQVAPDDRFCSGCGTRLRGGSA